MTTSTANITEARHPGRAAIADKTVLVAGANRGLGRALVEEARFGTWSVTEAVLPSGSHSTGAVVNVVSVGAGAAVSVLPAYSASKAAAFSLTQSVLPGPIDTDMVRDLPIPKTAPESVAQAIFDDVENGDAEIFPDPMSALLAEAWRTGVVKELERQNAALLRAQPSRQ